MSSPLPNYLLSNRKRLALSQDEVSFLLGSRGGSKVSRYEQFDRTPSLETALACEAIFQKPASELFRGIYKMAEKEVAARAKILNYKIDFKPTKKTARKRQALAELAAPKSNKILPQ